MLDGAKPLAMFYDIIPETAGVIPRKSFTPYVRSGKIISHEDRYDVSFDDASYTMIYVFYANAGQRERMMTLAKLIGEIRAGRPQGEKEDREIGLLLGYPESEVERFLKWQRGELKSPGKGKKKK